MATMNKPRGLLRTIIDGAAERIALQTWVAPENREAMRATAVSILEQQISAVLGSDSITLSGWVMPPSQRLERRERIEAALRAGESVKVISGRELVSQRWVFRVQAEMRGAEPRAPEQFSASRRQ